MKINIYSSIGKRRNTNQDYADYFTNKHQQNLIVLCDGVGGHQAGDVASQLTTKFLGNAFMELEVVLTPETVTEWLNNQIEAVNHYIFQESVANKELEGMGTTLVVAIQVEEVLVIAHVGDSRAYKYYQGNLEQITEDHSLVNELIKTGEITVEEGIHHPRRNVVTRSIGGTDEVEAEFNYLRIEELEILMICSDGLSNMVEKEELIEFFKEFSNQSDLGQRLVDAANDAGGSDNITVVLVSDLTSKEEEVEA